jgi:hypothetical protein
VPLTDVIPVPFRYHHRYVALHHSLASQPGIQLKIGSLLHAVDLIVINLRKIVHALFHNHMAGGAGAASAAGMFQVEPVVHRDIEQRTGEPVAFIGQFALFEFKRLVGGQKSYLGHSLIVATPTRGTAYNRGVVKKIAVLVLAVISPLAALDLRRAVLQLPPGATPIEKKAAAMVAEEVEKRTQVRLLLNSVPGAPVISIGKGSGPADGFTVTTSGNSVTIRGNDDRGVIFGAGYFLRQAQMSRQRFEIPDKMSVTTAPKVAIRGQQLGYRPKTNAYDGWSVPMWEQYIRELAIFGVNTVELIPPRSDDDADSPHFPLPPMDMMVEMSRIAGEYGLDVSIWYPAMDEDYSNPKTVDFALKEWAEVFRRLPRIDAVFVPGGDPGDTPPRQLLALLEKQTANLHRYHPKAQMWVSPQSFDKAGYDEFLSIANKQPAWLSGLVFGPQVRGSIVDLRERLAKSIPIRFYPDITHSLNSEFPVPAWDAAYATTEAREVINPRPVDQAAIFRRYVPYSSGFVTYSEGCNDDVNKFVWSGLGWNPDANVADLLRDYSRFFMGPALADPFAQGLLALERNWRGPLATNGGVDSTLAQFQSMERGATPQLRLNWRFQQALYRAHYDAFLRKRLLAETEQEERANSALRDTARIGSLRAMAAAEAVLDHDPLPQEARDLRARVFELAEALYQSIHMQLSVPRYQAIGLGRGANLDAIDFALSNRVWLKNQFAQIAALADEKARAARILRILDWADPGPGGFYDDLGDVAHQPHLVQGEPFDKDPDFLKSPLTGFGNLPQQGWRVSWFTDAETLGDTPLRMHYADLDRTAQYALRVVYGGGTSKTSLRLVANGSIEIHGFRPKPSPVAPVEFEIPRAATASGELNLEWTKPACGGGNGRGVQVSEVWLIRR